METVVQKWGNSLGIRIPAIYARELHLKDGSAIDIVQDDGKIVISQKKLSLPDMLSKVTNENIHCEINTGSSIGNEAW